MPEQKPRRRVLVVEDEMLIASWLEQILQRSGYDVVGPFGRLAAALEAAQSQSFDAALLDLNLHGEMAFQVAYTLRSRGTPFAFVTGYDQGHGIPVDLCDEAIVTKPIDLPGLLRVLRLLGLQSAEAHKPSDSP
jgi:DNA-binding response OmpR family regulator